MSEREQNEIAGRVLTEYVEARRQLAALRSKAAAMAAALNAIADELSPPSGAINPHQYRLSAPDRQKLIDGLPDRDQLAALANDIDQLVMRKRTLAATLSEMGVDPKD